MCVWHVVVIIVVPMVILVLEFVTISNRGRGELKEEEAKWVEYDHMKMDEYELRSWYGFGLLSYGYGYFL